MHMHAQATLSWTPKHEPSRNNCVQTLLCSSAAPQVKVCVCQAQTPTLY